MWQPLSTALWNQHQWQQLSHPVEHPLFGMVGILLFVYLNVN